MPASRETPARPDSGQAAFESEGHHRRSGYEIRCAPVHVLIEIMFPIRHLPPWFNEAAAQSGFQQHWDTLQRDSATFAPTTAPFWRLPVARARTGAFDGPSLREK